MAKARRGATKGLEEARHTFSEAGLSLPPVPQRFISKLRTIEKWCFATRRIEPMQMYFFDRYIPEALTGQCKDYVAFCHAGHGINSYALTYHLVDGPLILMVQTGWGGAYSDNAVASARVEAQFARCAALIDSVEAAKARGLDGERGRLIVFESEPRGEFLCAWFGRPLNPKHVRTKTHGHSAKVPKANILRLPATQEGLKTAGRLLRGGATPTRSKTQMPTAEARRWVDQVFP